MEVAGANRRWRCQFRCRGSRHESAVAQLFSLGRMNPFGIFSALQASMDAIGEVFGRQRKKDVKKERRERFWFAVLAMLLLVCSVTAIAIAIHEIYFDR